MGIFGWKNITTTCKSCKNSAQFRYAEKNAEFKGSQGWTKIYSGSSVVICPKCGDTIWIPQIVLEEIKLPPRK